MSTAKRKKEKKARPKLRPISSPDHASLSSALDEFGFSDVILTRGRDEPKIRDDDAAWTMAGVGARRDETDGTGPGFEAKDEAASSAKDGKSTRPHQHEAVTSLTASTTFPTYRDPEKNDDAVSHFTPPEILLTLEAKPAANLETSGVDEAVGSHGDQEHEAAPSSGLTTVIPSSRDALEKDPAISYLAPLTIQPESAADGKTTCTANETVQVHREEEDVAVSSFKTTTNIVETDATLKGEIHQSEPVAESGGSEASTAPSALLTSSPLGETGANYAAHYFCEETPETMKTHTTTDTDSITQHEEEDADGSLESIQQPDFEHDKKSTPTKSDEACDVKDTDMTTSTPVFSNVTTTCNAEAVKNIDSNDKAEENISIQNKRTKRRSTKRLQPRSTLFSPEDRKGPHPSTPDADGYDIFGFDLVKSESERAPAEDRQRDQEGIYGIEGSTEILKPVNLEEAYPADRVENIQADPSVVGEKTAVNDKLEEVLQKSVSVEATPSKSYSRGASSVSFGSPNVSVESEKSEIVHLLASQSDPRREGSRRYSCSDSESSFTSSDGETSYFSESRASTEGRNRPQCSTLSSKHLSKMPPSYPPNLPMRSHVHPPSTGFGTRTAIEMRLSLSVSEEDAEEARSVLPDELLDKQDDQQEELVLYEMYHPMRGDSFGSSLVESASSDSENENAHLHPLESTREQGTDDDRRHASVTPFSTTSASTDDAGVVNELSAYMMSSKIDDNDVQIETPPSGRLSPVGDGHIQSVLERKSIKSNDTPTPTNAGGARYIYADLQSAVVAANAKVGARKPTSLLDTPSLGSSSLQYNVKEATKPTQVHSPGGAFNTTSSKSSPYTPREKIHIPTGLHSLAYSDDDNIEPDEKPPPTFHQIKHEFDEEMAELIPISEVKTELSSSRWGLLFCVSILNLLAGWTCFSVAPIASTSEALGDVQSEYLVSLFLLAHCIASIFEPAILGRLGLRKTIVFGAFLLMLGSLVKSEGAPLLDLIGGGRGWRIYLGFFAAGFSHPLYQCTISILANAWFPESERRIASDIALNCYQLGITLSFVFGAFLVDSEADVNSYFQLISLTSVLAFCLASFTVEDAPPKPPSAALQSSETKRQKRLKKEQRKQRRKRSSTPKTNKNSKTDDSYVNAPTLERGESNLSVKEITCMDQGIGGVKDVKHEEQSLLVTQALPRSPSPTMSGIPSGRAYGSMENTQSAVSSNSSANEFDGVEPVIFQTPYNLDIDVRGDQVWILMRACFSFKGFSHCLLAYMASGLVINTLNTFISDLVQLNGAPKLYVGIVGGGFQLLTISSSIIFGKRANKARKIYRSILFFLVSGACALAMCSLQLVGSSSVGNLNLSIWILVVAFLVGPLPCLSTNLGSRVGRPLSDNSGKSVTLMFVKKCVHVSFSVILHLCLVLVIQRLFSNLVSAVCIPAFNMLRHYSVSKGRESPDFLFSIFLLVLLTVISAMYFSFFTSPTLLYEEEFYGCGTGTCPTNPNTMLILPYRKFAQPPYQPWVPPGRRKSSDKYPFLIPS
ncbi:hypothetical protein ACHAW6_011006 [Cyclotella cf. meneghiniana]